LLQGCVGVVIIVSCLGIISAAQFFAIGKGVFACEDFCYQRAAVADIPGISKLNGNDSITAARCSPDERIIIFGPQRIGGGHTRPAGERIKFQEIFHFLDNVVVVGPQYIRLLVKGDVYVPVIQIIIPGNNRRADSRFGNQTGIITGGNLAPVAVAEFNFRRAGCQQSSYNRQKERRSESFH